jgi:hypothetical protein
VAQEHRLGPILPDSRHNLIQFHGSEFRVQQFHTVAGIQKRPAKGKQTERRQMFPRDAAANRWMGRIDEQYSHKTSILDQPLLHFVLQSL